MADLDREDRAIDVAFAGIGGGRGRAVYVVVEVDGEEGGFKGEFGGRAGLAGRQDC